MVGIWLFILFIAINVFFAYIDANKIKNNKPIYHGINALEYSILVASVCLATQSLLLAIPLFLIRIPVFNTFLNYFRGKSLTYLSDTTTSIIDKLTNSIQKKVGYWTYNISILIIALILLVS